jgi:hypothetical protein
LAIFGGLIQEIHMRTSFRCAAIIALVMALSIGIRADEPYGPGQKLKNGKPEGRGWVSLIHKDLKGWKYEADYWKVENGALQGYTPGTPDHHYAYTEKEYGDFELHADVKLVGYNSGICIRIRPTSFDDVPGYQVDMGDGYWGCLWDERGRGMVAKFEKSEADKILKKDDWNHYYVKAQGHHIQAWLNGVKTIDVEDEKGNLTGPIGFQLTHGVGNKSAASFRNVYVKTVKK